MKRRINIVLIGILTVISLILAIPLSPLRQSFGEITKNTIHEGMNKYYINWVGKPYNTDRLFYFYDYEQLETESITIKTKKIKLKKFGASLLNDDYDISYGDNSHYIRSAIGLTGSFATVGNMSSISDDKQSLKVDNIPILAKTNDIHSVKTGTTSLQTTTTPSLPLEDGGYILLTFILIYTFIKTKFFISKYGNLPL